MLTAALLAGAGLYGSALGGHYPAIVKAVASRTGFAVDGIRITGNRETSEIDVLESLGLDGWTSLIGFDAGAARDRIAALPWVQSVAVRKVYPDAIEVEVVEKTPFAIWQHEQELSLIERNGDVIAPFRGGRYAALPLVVGEGAARRAQAIVGKVEQIPDLAPRIRGYIRIADRRWDVRLDNGVTVKLPEAGESAALATLLAVDAQQGLLSRDIVAVDMRLEDRLVVQLTPEGIERRKADIAQRLKAKAAAERRT